MPIVAWIMSRLTTQIAAPLLGLMLIANIASGVGLAITRHTLHLARQEYAAEVKAHEADIATFKAATAQAEANDKAHALAVQQQQDQITKEKTDDLQKQLASARTIAARWLRTHGAPTADRGGSQAAPVPSTSDTSSDPAGEPASAIVPASDVDACTVAFTVAKGWQDWWSKEQPVMQAGAAPSDPPAVGIEGTGAQGTFVLGQSVDTGKVMPQSEADPDPGDEHDPQHDQNNFEGRHKNFLP